MRVKNYETVSKFVKVRPNILWPLFPWHGVVWSAIGMIMFSVCLWRCASWLPMPSWATDCAERDDRSRSWNKNIMLQDCCSYLPTWCIMHVCNRIDSRSRQVDFILHANRQIVIILGGTCYKGGHAGRVCISKRIKSPSFCHFFIKHWPIFKI